MSDRPYSYGSLRAVKRAPVIRRSRSSPGSWVCGYGRAWRPFTSLRDVSLRRKPRPLARLRRRRCAAQASPGHSTVTDLARLRGLSTSVPLAQAVW